MSPTPEPVAAPPTRRSNKPADRAPMPAQVSSPVDEPARHSPSHDLEQRDVLLASMLASKSATREDPIAVTENTPGQPRTPYGAFMGISRTVEPDRDLASCAPRLPRYVLAAINLIRNASGRTQQQIIADALTGAHPIPEAALDAAYLELYGKARPAPH